MEEELNALNRTLISLVVSSPTAMTVNSLVKDYRNMVGGVIPISKFGYKDYITFVKECCSDIFVLEGSSWDPILTPKVTKNLKHIDQMVQKQKVQSSIKYKGKRRSVPSAVNPPRNPHLQKNLVSESFKNNVRPANNYNKSSVYREKTPIYRAETKVPPVKESNMPNPLLIESTKQNGYKDEETAALTVSSKFNGNEDKENINNSSERPSSGLSKFYKKRLPRYTSEMDLQSNADGSSKDSNDSGAHSSSSSSSKLEEMKNGIVELIMDSAEGVWFTDLIRLYKERYGRELKLQQYGYTSLANLVMSLQDRITVTRLDPLGDYLLRDPESAAAADRGRGLTLPLRRSSRYQSSRVLATDPDDALPGIEIDADVYPSDCMHYLERIPSADITALSGGSQIEVLIGEVYSPSHFWMQQVGPEHNLAMEAVMDRMNEHYMTDTRELVPGALRVGQYCAALYERDWHRSLIVQIVDSDTVKVRHVDYGTVDMVPTSALRYLPREFGQLRSQAVRARLAVCRPSAGGQRWTHAAATDFLRAVRDKRLYANIVAVDREEDIVETFLIDTSRATDVCLMRELVRLGHADTWQDSGRARDESYLYPRFEALETGSTPNYAEISRLLNDGIELDFVDAYRRYVPAPSAAPITPHSPPPPPMELANRVPLMRHASPSPTPSEEPALSPTPHFQSMQPSLSHHQPTQDSLPQYQNTQPQYQAAQYQHQMTQHQHQNNQSQYQMTQPQYQVAQTQHHMTQSQYQTNQTHYQTNQHQFQSGQEFISQFQMLQVRENSRVPNTQYQSQYQTTQTVHSQLQTPQQPHSQYQTSQAPPSQVQTTQSPILQLHSQCKATQASQFRPTHSQQLSQLQSVQPRSKTQMMHPSQMPQAPKPTVPHPPTQRPLQPTLAPCKAVHSSVAQTRSARPFIMPSLPIRPQQLLTPIPVRPALLPTPPPALPTLRPTVQSTPSTPPLVQPSQPTVPQVPLGSLQPVSSAPAQASSPSVPPGFKSPVAAALPAPNEVRLTEDEWTVLAHLRATDPAAAEWFLTTTAWRVICARCPAPPPSMSPFDCTPAGETDSGRQTAASDFDK